MKRVCFVPAVSNNNKYVDLVRMSITRAGYDLSKKNSLSDILKCAIIHFNWYEGIPNGSKVMKWKSYSKKILILNIMRLLHKEIIFTLHNKMTHEDENEGYSKKLILWFLNYSNRIVVHCLESVDVIKNLSPKVDLSLMHYVPHPNYVSVYQNIDKYKYYEKNDGELLLLFIGQIRPYKNVEIIISAANLLKDNKKIKFLICGKCHSEEYRSELLSLIQCSNIITDFRFISDDQIPSLLALADIVMLPYNTDSALNSGAAYLAFSNRRTVISTDIGTIKDFSESGLIYSYQYSSNDLEHINSLVRSIKSAYQNFSVNRNYVSMQGEKLYEIMLSKHSIEEVSKSIKNVYE